MSSKAREDCTASVNVFSKIIKSTLSKGNLLYIGLAGDPKGGEYSSLFLDFNIITADCDQRWGPDIILDISKDKIEKYKNYFDVIVCTQVIEHVPDFWKIPEIINFYLKTNGYLIIDCPFFVEYHAEPPSFGDYWRITKDGFKYIFNKEYYKLISINDTKYNTSCLIQKI